MYKYFLTAFGLGVGGYLFFKSNSTVDYVAAALCLVGGGFSFLYEIFASKIDKKKLFWGTLGLFSALAVTGLLFPLLMNLGIGANFVAVVAVFLATLAVSAFVFFSETASGIKVPKPIELIETEKPLAEVEVNRVPKVLDTSIVIDGRIIDIASTGFIEGPFIVPNFVLREIQLISDSPDSIKRNRGRRGLDMLNQLRKREDLEVKIDYKDYSDTREVDAKLVKLAKDLNGKLVTNDFNLNKVAQLQGIEVLNINNLANALKPVVLPGEEMDIQVVKEGKDENQGIGYLDDGTMVVIENGGKLLNKKVTVVVTSVIQTNAGKMIFTRVVPK